MASANPMQLLATPSPVPVSPAAEISTPVAAGEDAAALFARVLTQRLQLASSLPAVAGIPSLNPSAPPGSDLAAGADGTENGANGAKTVLSPEFLAGLPAGNGNFLPVASGETDSVHGENLLTNANALPEDDKDLAGYLQLVGQLPGGASPAGAVEGLPDADGADDAATSAQILEAALARLPSNASPTDTPATPAIVQEMAAGATSDADTEMPALPNVLQVADLSGLASPKAKDSVAADEKVSADSGEPDAAGAEAAAQAALAAMAHGTQTESRQGLGGETSVRGDGRGTGIAAGGGTRAEAGADVSLARFGSTNWATGADAAQPSSGGESKDAAMEALATAAAAPDVPATASPQAGKPSPEFAAALQSVQSAPAAAPKENVPALEKPVGQPGWSQDVGERVTWMTQRGEQTAEIRLNPPHLGPLEVRIDIDRDRQASVQFVAHHAVVREALEAAMPRLREMLSAQQLTLTDATVSQQSFGDRSGAQAGFEQQNRQGRGFQGEGADVPVAPYPETEAAVSSRSGNGLLSLYA